MSKQNLSKAVAIAGGQSALAIKLGVKQAHVWGWLHKTKDGLPPEQVLPVCYATHWQVTPNQLRPDLYPHPKDGLPEPMRSEA